MQLDEVGDREKLAMYVRELAAEAARDELPKGSLESFLGALAAWVDDMDGYFANLGAETPKQPDWQLVASMLRAASVYE